VELAASLGISQAAISLIEAGRMPASAERVASIARVLRVPVTVLVGSATVTITTDSSAGTPPADVAPASDRFARYRAATGREA
jgi:transcriptional regulator with XRE-family HTH domain